jgi:hypothetical protein
MRSALLAVAMMLGACESMGGHGHGGGGGYSHGGGESHSSGGGESHASSHSSSSSSHDSRGHDHDQPLLSSATRAVVRTVGEALLAGALDPDADPPGEVGPPTWEYGGPLIDNHDPCNRCPEDVACGQCAGAGGKVCSFAPAGAFARCASSN